MLVERWYGRPDLILGVVVLLEVRVGQGLLHCDSPVWVEGEHLVQQVQCCGRQPVRGITTGS